MRGLFKRTAPAGAPDTAALGTDALALRVPSGTLVPHACIGLACGKGGATRRVEHGARLAAGDSKSAYCFHPGPYSIELTPFAAAPEIGLQLSFVVDDPDPRVAQQRFDLYLASEGGEGVSLAAFALAVDSALQRELAQGNLELPPCTTLDEWNLFRAGLNQLLYQRFGVTVEDCLPVDLGDRVDYAQLLLARAVDVRAKSAVSAPAPSVPALTDAQALRRLFLELPGVTSALRLVALPPGQALFRQHQALLQRLDGVALLFATMPSLELAAPGIALDVASRAARERHSAGAVLALDEAWSLAARFAHAPAASWFDDADRIVANLKHHGAGRRASEHA